MPGEGAGAPPPSFCPLEEVFCGIRNVLTDIPETIKQCKLLTVIEASVNPLQKIPEGNQIRIKGQTKTFGVSDPD